MAKSTVIRVQISPIYKTKTVSHHNSDMGFAMSGRDAISYEESVRNGSLVSFQKAVVDTAKCAEKAQKIADTEAELRRAGIPCEIIPEMGRDYTWEDYHSFEVDDNLDPQEYSVWNAMAIHHGIKGSYPEKYHVYPKTTVYGEMVCTDAGSNKVSELLFDLAVECIQDKGMQLDERYI